MSMGPWVFSRAGVAQTTTTRVARDGARTGAPLLGPIWLPFVVAAKVTGGAFPVFGDDTVAYARHIDAAVDAFWDDVVRDSCRSRFWYDVETGQWMEPSRSLRASVCKGPRAIPVDQVRPTALADWRNALVLWVQDWRAYHASKKDVWGYRPNREDLDTWYAQLEGDGGWRQQFEKNGGKTVTPKAPKPEPVVLVPWKSLIWLAGIAAGAYAISVASRLLPERERVPERGRDASEASLPTRGHASEETAK